MLIWTPFYSSYARYKPGRVLRRYRAKIGAGCIAIFMILLSNSEITTRVMDWLSGSYVGRLEITCKSAGGVTEGGAWLLELAMDSRSAIRATDFGVAGVELVEGEILSVIDDLASLNLDPGPIPIDWGPKQILLKPGIINSGSRSKLRVEVSGLSVNTTEPWRRVGQIANVKVVLKHLPKVPHSEPSSAPLRRDFTWPVVRRKFPEIASSNPFQREPRCRDLLFASGMFDRYYSGPSSEFLVSDSIGTRGGWDDPVTRDFEVIFERNASQVLSPVDWTTQKVVLQERLNSLVGQHGVIVLLGDATQESDRTGGGTSFAMAASVGKFLEPIARKKGWRVSVVDVSARDDLRLTCIDKRRTVGGMGASSPNDSRKQNVVHAIPLSLARRQDSSSMGSRTR